VEPILIFYMTPYILVVVFGDVTLGTPDDGGVGRDDGVGFAISRDGAMAL
jgi:hypothetical protein